MILYLIRHGQSTNNAAPIEQRVADAPLTELGFKQVARVAEWAASADLNRLITSPFLRTLQTTEPIRRATGLQPLVRTDLHEQGGCISGQDEASYRGERGMTRDQILADFPGYDVPAEVDGSGWWKGRSYEPPERARARAKRVAQWTHQSFANTDETVAFVIHGTFKAMLITALLNQLHTDERWLGDIFNTAVTRIAITSDQTRLDYYNSVSHLSVPMITG